MQQIFRLWEILFPIEWVEFGELKYIYIQRWANISEWLEYSRTKSSYQNEIMALFCKFFIQCYDGLSEHVYKPIQEAVLLINIHLTV